MNDFAALVDQVRQFVGQHVEPGTLARTVPAAVGAFLLGAGFCVFGAKLARVGITTLFVALGLLAGHRFGVVGGLQPAICAAIGGAVLGAISFLTFRLWVGMATGLILTFLVVGAFGTQRVLPHVTTFEPLAAAGASGEFALPSPEAQKLYLDRSPKQFFDGLSAHLVQQDRAVLRDGQLLAGATLAFGVLLGVLAMRWMLIFTTSLAGTFLVTTSVATMMTHFIPKSYNAIVGYPKIGAVGVGVCFLGSLIVQYMLTRKAGAPRTE